MNRNAEEFIENLSTDRLRCIARMIYDMNKEYWLNQRKGTHGYYSVLEDGFTSNQKEWLKTISEDLKEVKR